MIGLNVIKSRITIGLQRNGIKFLTKNQKRTGNAIQYVKRTTFFTTKSNLRFPGTFKDFSLSTSQKSLIYQRRPFHATRPTSIPAPPAFLLLFKTTNATLAIRYLSNLFLSFLPYALRKNPKTGEPRRMLIFLTTGIPFIGFCIIILTGLEQAPHTGRLRFKFMSEEEENNLCNLAFSHVVKEYENKFLSPDRIESIFVYHVASNLVKGLNNNLMTLKSFKNLNNNKSNEEVANIIEENVDNMSDTNTNIQLEQKPKPFEIYVIKNDDVFNALSFGVSKKIIIFTGWLKLINYDEEYLAVTLSHEMAHIMQGHTSESFGLSQILYLFTDTVRTLLWPILSIFGPLLNDYLNSTTQMLIEKYASGRYNQKAEKEADIVGLQLMALSGYHPKKAVELWKYLSSISNQNKPVLQDNNNSTEEIIEIEDISELPSVLKDLEDFFASHPLEEVRANYLFDVLPEAEKIYEKTILEDGKALLFDTILNSDNINEPVKSIKNVEDQITFKIWNSLRYLMGLNSES